MKKLFITALTASFVLSGASLAHAEGNQKGEHPKQEFHKGEVPIEVIPQPNGVIVKVYEVSTPLPQAQPFAGSLTFAGDGVWNQVGSESWILNNTGVWRQDSVYLSTGGDYMIRIPAHTRTSGMGNSIHVLLLEDDIAQDDTVSDFYTNALNSSKSCDYVVSGINAYLDGPLVNGMNHAELYTKHNSEYNGSSPTVKYFD